MRLLKSRIPLKSNRNSGTADEQAFGTITSDDGEKSRGNRRETRHSPRASERDGGESGFALPWVGVVYRRWLSLFYRTALHPQSERELQAELNRAWPVGQPGSGKRGRGYVEILSWVVRAA